MLIFLIVVFVVAIAAFLFFSAQKKKKGTDEYRETPAAPGETGSDPEEERPMGQNKA